MSSFFFWNTYGMMSKANAHWGEYLVQTQNPKEFNARKGTFKINK